MRCREDGVSGASVDAANPRDCERREGQKRTGWGVTELEAVEGSGATRASSRHNELREGVWGEGAARVYKLYEEHNAESGGKACELQQGRVHGPRSSSDARAHGI